MPHSWSPLSLNLICLACGAHRLAAGPECQPSAAESDDAEAALAAYLADLDPTPRTPRHRGVPGVGGGVTHHPLAGERT